VALATDISPILQLRKMGVISSVPETSGDRLSTLGSVNFPSVPKFSLSAVDGLVTPKVLVNFLGIASHTVRLH
jgi:hypothetical protein